jgi:hypothetical protein
MKLKWLFTLAFVCLVLTYGNAQNQFGTSQSFYSLKAGPGKVLEAYSLMPATKPSVFTAFEFGKAADGSHAWHSYINYPEYGCEILYGNLNNDFLGNVYAVQPFLRWKLREHTKPLEINFSAGLGFAYFTEKYHFFENPENGLIGSHITNYTKGELEIGYRVNTWRIFASIGAFHFSNGHVKLPNIGANVPEAKLGFTWFYEHTEPNPGNGKQFSEPDKSWSPTIRIATGLHAYGSTMKPFGGKSYPVFSAGFSMTKNLSAAYRISFGGIAGYYQGYNNFLLSELKQTHSDAILNAGYTTVYFGQELMMGKIAVYGEFGIDVFKPFIRNYGDVFDIESGFGGFVKSYNSNRLGLKYYLHTINQSGFNANIGVFIKANYAQAEFAECALEIVF